MPQHGFHDAKLMVGGRDVTLAVARSQGATWAYDEVPRCSRRTWTVLSRAR